MEIKIEIKTGNKEKKVKEKKIKPKKEKKKVWGLSKTIILIFASINLDICILISGEYLTSNENTLYGNLMGAIGFFGSCLTLYFIIKNLKLIKNNEDLKEYNTSPTKTLLYILLWDYIVKFVVIIVWLLIMGLFGDKVVNKVEDIVKEACCQSSGYIWENDKCLNISFGNVKNEIYEYEYYDSINRVCR